MANPSLTLNITCSATKLKITHYVITHGSQFSIARDREDEFTTHGFPDRKSAVKFASTQVEKFGGTAVIAPAQSVVSAKAKVTPAVLA